MREEERGRLIAAVLEDFDVDKVQAAMDAIDEKWRFDEDPPNDLGPAWPVDRLPTVAEIRAKAREMLDECLRIGEGHWTWSGGLEASMEDGRLWLRYVADYSSAGQEAA